MPIMETYEVQPPDLPGYLAVRVWRRGGQMGDERWVWTYIRLHLPQNDIHTDSDYVW